MYKYPALILCLLMSFTAIAGGGVDLDNYYSSAKIVYKGDQWYQQDFASEKLTYMADVVTRQCYFIDRRWNAVLSIECKDLVRRKEWLKVLTWIKTE